MFISLFTFSGTISLILLLLSGISCDNNIIAKNEEVNSAWAQMERTCQCRIDLIPNLVKAGSAYISHQKNNAYRSNSDTNQPSAKTENAGEGTAAGIVGRKKPQLNGATYYSLTQNDNFPGSS